MCQAPRHQTESVMQTRAEALRCVEVLELPIIDYVKSEGVLSMLAERTGHVSTT